ncbi:MAG TPA: helix-turn-helix domain-containing protein [Solirubrobacterales bacterium]|nr:helix-turn-helix domain-containing protein [Solirubrobacterales bacterium]
MSRRPLLSDEAIAAFREIRFTDALAAECLERGYRATTISHVVARARTSRNTVYKSFPNKEAILLALVERVLADVERRVDLACEVAGDDPHDRVEAGLGVVLDWVAADPAAANAVLVEAPTIESAFERQSVAISGYVERLGRCLPASFPRSEVVEGMRIEGVVAILRRQVVAGEAVIAPTLLPALFGFLTDGR